MSYKEVVYADFKKKFNHKKRILSHKNKMQLAIPDNLLRLFLTLRVISILQGYF